MTTEKKNVLILISHTKEQKIVKRMIMWVIKIFGSLHSADKREGNKMN
jgi:hypothetical protein